MSTSSGRSTDFDFEKFRLRSFVEGLPISFAVGNHPLDFYAATTRKPVDEIDLLGTLRGETAPVVKSLKGGAPVTDI